MVSGKMLGAGKTACVYEWEENKVLKLFHQGYPYEAVKKEYNNAITIRNMNFLKPKVYEMISYENKMGIVYDRIEGESLLNWVLKTGDVQGCAIYMAKLHKEIIQNKSRKVPDYKEFLRFHITKTESSFTKPKELIQMMDELPDGDALCHGDFHPGNILISGEGAYVIDFMNICHGNYLYDVARTVFLIEYTPVPPEANDRDQIVQFKKLLSELYLLQMNVTREMIKDYLSVIIIARKGECSEE